MQRYENFMKLEISWNTINICIIFNLIIDGSIVEAPCIYDYSNVPIKCNNDSFKFLKPTYNELLRYCSFIRVV